MRQPTNLLRSNETSTSIYVIGSRPTYDAVRKILKLSRKHIWRCVRNSLSVNWSFPIRYLHERIEN